MSRVHTHDVEVVPAERRTDPASGPPTALEQLRGSLLDQRRLDELFVDHLGWDDPPADSRVVLADDGVAADQIAKKRGVGV